MTAVKTAPKAARLTTAQFAEEQHITEETARKWRRDGRGPAYYRDGEGFIRYRREDIDAWEKSLLVTPGAA